MSKLERLCIRVPKVYDWVTRQVDKDFNFVGEEGLDRLSFQCNGTPDADPCELLEDDQEFIVSVIPTDAQGNEIDLDEIECREVGHRRDVFVEDLGIELQTVKLKKQGFFKILLHLEEDGAVVCESAPIPFCIFEKFLLCAPEGTDIECHVFDFFGTGVVCCNNGQFIDLALTLTICQSIQAEADVKVEVEGRICKPREDIIEPIVERVCPEIEFPPQCPEIFPPKH
ncbi:hypothetical protein J2S74_002753 [Evansella vedderi]|uniref:SipL SPOCS domain-containing protein n=1 Tax=Evansella vedderi TaxID=38282 RepID=A0ABT9ZXA3_9BACI|nr:hypothetical protein [Evansella vedderi]MDQ0255371.1 hypothetical protein [Evansella vedderi]